MTALRAELTDTRRQTAELKEEAVQAGRYEAAYRKQHAAHQRQLHAAATERDRLVHLAAELAERLASAAELVPGLRDDARRCLEWQDARDAEGGGEPHQRRAPGGAELSDDAAAEAAEAVAAELARMRGDQSYDRRISGRRPVAGAAPVGALSDELEEMERRREERQRTSMKVILFE